MTVLALGRIVAGKGAAQLDGFLGRGDGVLAVSPVLLWYDGSLPTGRATVNRRRSRSNAAQPGFSGPILLAPRHPRL